MITRVFLSGEKAKVMPVQSLSDFNGRRFSWVRVLEPTPEELALVASFLSLDENSIDDLKSFLQDGDRSRVEKDLFLQIVYAVPVIVDNEIETEELMIFSNSKVVITIERKKLSICEKYMQRAEKNQARYLFSRNAGFFVTELVDEANTRFLHHVNKIENNIDVWSGKSTLLSRSQIEAISSASNTLSFFNQATLANIEVLNTLKKMYHSTFTPVDRAAFSDIYFDSLQILDALKIQREMIMNLFSIQSIISSNQMNVFMKKLTAIALIIMVPTLISGIYGMNVEGLPFASHVHGFWLVLGSLFIITVAIYLGFKKADWL